jgi:glycosidase
MPSQQQKTPPLASRFRSSPTGSWHQRASSKTIVSHGEPKARSQFGRNPQIRAAIYDVMRFWLRRGVDGFRVDVIWHLIKDEAFRDNPSKPAFRPEEPPHHALVPLYTTDRPEVHAVISEMRRIIDEFPDRLLIGEIYLPLERLTQYYGRDLTGLHLPFNFSLLSAAWDPQSIAKLVEEYEAALPPGGWPNWVLGNHDRPRIASRVGGAQARIAAMLLLTLRGTPTIYYGDDIGMQDVAIPRERIRDVVERNIPEPVSVETDAGRQCNGTPHGLPGFPSTSPGFRCQRPLITRTSKTSGAMARPSFRCIGS